MLEDHADTPSQRLQFLLAKPADLAAFNADFARIRSLQSVQASDQCRFARAAAADDAENLTLTHGQRHALQCRRFSEATLQIDKTHDLLAVATSRFDRPAGDIIVHCVGQMRDLRQDVLIHGLSFPRSLLRLRIERLQTEQPAGRKAASCSPFQIGLHRPQ